MSMENIPYLPHFLFSPNSLPFLPPARTNRILHPYFPKSILAEWKDSTCPKLRTLHYCPRDQRPAITGLGRGMEEQEQKQTGWGTSPKLLTPHSHPTHPRPLPPMDNPVLPLPVRFESRSPLS